MGWQVQGSSLMLGVLGFAEGEGRGARVRDYDWPKDEPLTHGYG